MINTELNIKPEKLENLVIEFSVYNYQFIIYDCMSLTKMFEWVYDSLYVDPYSELV